ncbi:hypothetical protein BGX30_003546 [Mortierella sp. GBA39]|nr:hypothetical protein BGX30_003546 [Mortierella sp. GBA39]
MNFFQQHHPISPRHFNTPDPTTMIPTTKTLQATSGRRPAGPSIQIEAEPLHPERANQNPKAALDSAQTKMLKNKRPVDKSSLNLNNQINCDDKDDDDGDGDVEATPRVKSEKMEEENAIGSSSGGGISTVISQELTILKLNQLLMLIEMMESFSSTAQLDKGMLKRLLDLKGSVHDSPNGVAVHDDQVAASA